jgi:hypothetical protein
LDINTPIAVLIEAAVGRVALFSVLEASGFKSHPCHERKLAVQRVLSSDSVEFVRNVLRNRHRVTLHPYPACTFAVLSTGALESMSLPTGPRVGNSKHVACPTVPVRRAAQGRIDADVVSCISVSRERAASSELPHRDGENTAKKGRAQRRFPILGLLLTSTAEDLSYGGCKLLCIADYSVRKGDTNLQLMECDAPCL